MSYNPERSGFAETSTQVTRQEIQQKNRKSISPEQRLKLVLAGLGLSAVLAACPEVKPRSEVTEINGVPVITLGQNNINKVTVTQDSAVAQQVLELLKTGRNAVITPEQWKSLGITNGLFQLTPKNNSGAMLQALVTNQPQVFEVSANGEVLGETVGIPKFPEDNSIALPVDKCIAKDLIAECAVSLFVSTSDYDLAKKTAEAAERRTPLDLTSFKKSILSPGETVIIQNSSPITNKNTISYNDRYQVRGIEKNGYTIVDTRPEISSKISLAIDGIQCNWNSNDVNFGWADCNIKDTKTVYLSPTKESVPSVVASLNSGIPVFYPSADFKAVEISKFVACYEPGWKLSVGKNNFIVAVKDSVQNASGRVACEINTTIGYGVLSDGKLEVVSLEPKKVTVSYNDCRKESFDQSLTTMKCYGGFVSSDLGSLQNKVNTLNSTPYNVYVDTNIPSDYAKYTLLDGESLRVIRPTVLDKTYYLAKANIIDRDGSPSIETYNVIMGP